MQNGTRLLKNAAKAIAENGGWIDRDDPATERLFYLDLIQYRFGLSGIQSRVDGGRRQVRIELSIEGQSRLEKGNK